MNRPDRTNRSRPFREGEMVTVEPQRIGKRGDGEAFLEGWRLQVEGGLPGERAKVRVLHVSRGGRVARARFLAPAGAAHPSRRQPPCPIHEKCGGCGLQQIEEGAALLVKIAQAKELLPGHWEEPIRSPRLFAYRNKALLLPQVRGTRLVLGARPPRGDRLVDTAGCGVLRPELERVAAHARALLRPESAISLRSLMLRCNREGQTIATLVHRGDGADLADLDLPADALYRQRHDGAGNRVCSDEVETLVRGDGALAELFGEVRVRIPPTAFWQANPDVAEALYQRAARELGGGRMAEIYCGAGAAGLLALREFPESTLLGIDKSPRAIEAARESARANGLLERCTFEARDAAEVTPEWDAVLVNPPRTGCHARVLDAIARSHASRLLYLSCNPESLARDAALLGWETSWILPADMLPQTPHLELLACFTRR